MSQTARMDHETAHNILVDLHKRAFLGLLDQQYDVRPSTLKEAHALLDLGVDLLRAEEGAAPQKTASAGQYGDGFFGQLKQAFDKQAGSMQPQGAPGFESLGTKTAGYRQYNPADDLPPALVDAAYSVAHQLAQNPNIFEAACVKRAQIEELLSAQQ